MKKFRFHLVLLIALLLGTVAAAELNFKGKTIPVAGQRSLGYWGICTLDAPMAITPGMELIYEI